MARIQQLFLFLTAVPLSLTSPFSVPFRNHKAFYRSSGSAQTESSSDDPGSPVYLTPYIKAGQLDQGLRPHVSRQLLLAVFAATIYNTRLGQGNVLSYRLEIIIAMDNEPTIKALPLAKRS